MSPNSGLGEPGNPNCNPFFSPGLISPAGGGEQDERTEVERREIVMGRSCGGVDGGIDLRTALRENWRQVSMYVREKGGSNYETGVMRKMGDSHEEGL